MHRSSQLHSVEIPSFVPRCNTKRRWRDLTAKWQISRKGLMFPCSGWLYRGRMHRDAFYRLLRVVLVPRGSRDELTIPGGMCKTGQPNRTEWSRRQLGVPHTGWLCTCTWKVCGDEELSISDLIIMATGNFLQLVRTSREGEGRGEGAESGQCCPHGC